MIELRWTRDLLRSGAPCATGDMIMAVVSGGGLLDTFFLVDIGMLLKDFPAKGRREERGRRPPLAAHGVQHLLVIAPLIQREGRESPGAIHDRAICLTADECGQEMLTTIALCATCRFQWARRQRCA